MSKARKDPIRAQVDLIKRKLSAENISQNFENFFGAFAKLEGLQNIDHQREIFLEAFAVEKFDGIVKALLGKTNGGKESFLEKFKKLLSEIGSNFSQEYKQSCQEFIQTVLALKEQSTIPNRTDYVPSHASINPLDPDHADEALLKSYLDGDRNSDAIIDSLLANQKPNFFQQVRDCFSKEKSEEIPDKLKEILRELFKEDPQVNIESFTNKVFEGREDFEKLFAESEILNSAFLAVQKESEVVHERAPSPTPQVVHELREDYLQTIYQEGDLNNFCNKFKVKMMSNQQIISEYFPNQSNEVVSRELKIMINNLTREIIGIESEDYEEKFPRARSFIEGKLRDSTDDDVKSVVQSIKEEQSKSAFKKLKISDPQNQI